MATPGRKPKPAATKKREGNPGKRDIKEGVKFNPDELQEPDWKEVFPGTKAGVTRLRLVASEMWKKLAPALTISAGLVHAQQETLQDYCTTWARIDQGERSLTLEGVLVPNERGFLVKNPWTTVLSSYRSHLRSLIGELGLSPSAATRLGGKDTDDEDDPFD